MVADSLENLAEENVNVAEAVEADESVVAAVNLQLRWVMQVAGYLVGYKRKKLLR